MDNDSLTRLVVTISLFIIAIAFSLSKFLKKRDVMTSRFIAKTAVFAAISIILYIVPIFNLSLPIFPFFLKIHFDEIPALIAGMAYGPLSGVLIIVIKTIVKLPMTSTLGVGELADLLYSIAFVLPAALIYRKHRHIQGAVCALGIATIVQLIVSSFVTSFAIINFYIFVMRWDEVRIIDACRAVNPSVNSLGWPFFFMIALPFNALKDAMVVVITFLLYKRLHTFIDRFETQKN